MKQPKHPIDRWSVYTAAGFLAFCGMMMFTLMPLFVGAMQRHYGFKESQIGDIVGCYFAGVVLVSLTTVAWIRRFNWRTIVAVGQAISAVAFFLSMKDHTNLWLSVLLGVAGIGGGITYALSFTLLGDSDDPDRAFGVNIGFQTLLSSTIYIVLPQMFANDSSDLRTLLLAMAVIVTVTSLGAFWLPRSGPKVADAVTEARVNPAALKQGLWLPLVGTAITFLFMMACTAPWVFIEQAAVAKGVEPVFIGFTLAAAQFVSLIGSAASALIGTRFGKMGPMCLGVVIYLLGIYLLFVFDGRDTFAWGACIFLLPINFLLAFSLGLTAEVDTGGRLIGLSTISLLGPSLIAPSIAGRLYERYGFGSNLWIGVVTAILALLMYGWLLQAARRQGLSGSQVTTLAIVSES